VGGEGRFEAGWAGADLKQPVGAGDLEGFLVVWV
jgi:hypothetical protein